MKLKSLLRVLRCEHVKIFAGEIKEGFVVGDELIGWYDIRRASILYGHCDVIGVVSLEYYTAITIKECEDHEIN